MLCFTSPLLRIRNANNPRIYTKVPNFTHIYNYFITLCFLYGIYHTYCFVPSLRYRDLSKISTVIYA